jgi:hypothetical protein
LTEESVPAVRLRPLTLSPHISQLGYVPTYIILVLSLPTFLFLFYAAVKKGQFEAEEDDVEDYY